MLELQNASIAQDISLDLVYTYYVGLKGFKATEFTSNG